MISKRQQQKCQKGIRLFQQTLQTLLLDNNVNKNEPTTCVNRESFLPKKTELDRPGKTLINIGQHSSTFSLSLSLSLSSMG